MHKPPNIMMCLVWVKRVVSSGRCFRNKDDRQHLLQKTKHSPRKLCISHKTHTHTHKHTRSRCPKTRKTHIGHENNVSNVNNKVSRYRKVEPRLICKSFLWGGVGRNRKKPRSLRGSGFAIRVKKPGKNLLSAAKGGRCCYCCCVRVAKWPNVKCRLLRTRKIAGRVVGSVRIVEILLN